MKLLHLLCEETHTKHLWKSLETWLLYFVHTCVTVIQPQTSVSSIEIVVNPLWEIKRWMFVVIIYPSSLLTNVFVAVSMIVSHLLTVQWWLWLHLSTKLVRLLAWESSLGHTIYSTTGFVMKQHNNVMCLEHILLYCLFYCKWEHCLKNVHQCCVEEDLKLAIETTNSSRNSLLLNQERSGVILRKITYRPLFEASGVAPCRIEALLH